MGGSAFSDLNIPRIPSELYFQLKNRYLQVVREFYKDADSPIEAPEKQDHGDIDLIVAKPNCQIPILKIAQLLDASRIMGQGQPTKNLAIPCPELGINKHVQLDIHECKPGAFTWEVFHLSHGDLWSILGPSIRAYGFVVTDTGLHVCINEIEPHNKKLSRVFLTNDPEAVLEFLGLDMEQYRDLWDGQKPFPTIDAMFKFAVENRFFRSNHFIRENLRPHDRKRLKQREIYRRFIEEWLPNHYMTGDEKWPPTQTIESHSSSGQEKHDVEIPKIAPTTILPSTSDFQTRQGIIDEALERFGKRNEYDMKLTDWRRALQELEEKRKLKAIRRADAEARLGDKKRQG
ncbi:MAG: hypothetical protein M1834_005030 [Cirrosporium novae-zelandiae]|nr:MAG: hypothetical protein M1834_005030 [Cirrosporium novae-zelandiae]